MTTATRSLSPSAWSGGPVREAALHAFRTPVRGHAFAGRPRGTEPPRVGRPARLAREPANPADPLAVAVWVDAGPASWRIGYLDRTVAARLAPRLDRGARLDACLDGWVPEPDGRWDRPVVLVLPVSRPAPGSEEADALPRDWGRPPGVVRRRIG